MVEKDERAKFAGVPITPELLLRTNEGFNKLVDYINKQAPELIINGYAMNSDGVVIAGVGNGPQRHEILLGLVTPGGEAISLITPQRLP
jgi:hypothetical protein